MRLKFAERLFLVALCAALAWFYTWTVRSSGDPWKFGLEQRDYYNLLLDGWLDGQLHLKVDVPEALLRLPDPYDPTKRPVGLGLHDATFYQGKYYLYFGAAPMVVLMLPFRLWTGIDLPLAVATLIFVYGAFLVSVAIFLGVRRRYFPGAGMVSVLLGVTVLGLAGLGPVLLRRPHMWELPIGAGSFFALLSLWCVWHSVHAHGPRVEGNRRGNWRRAWWFAGAGLGLGLAIASRPTYLIGSPYLLVPIVVWVWRSRGAVAGGGERYFAAWRVLPWRELLAAFVPLALVGTAMAWHNFARFDHPLQFGQAYQFSLDYESKMAHFRATHVPFNLWRYFFSAAEWSGSFPFIQPAELPPKPPGFGGHDDVYGLLTNLPIAWLALATPLALWRRDRTERAALGAWLATTALLFAGMAGTLTSFFGSLARYQSDFTPALMLLAVAGGLALERWLRAARTRPWQWAGGIAGGGAALFSAGFAVLFSLQLDGLLRERNPAKFREVARDWNRAPAAMTRLMGVRHGPIELTLQITPAAPGTRELLLLAGDAPRQDRVFLLHNGAGQIRFEVESPHGVRRTTRPVTAEPAATNRLRVSLGSLLPPEAHPDFGDATETEVAAMTRRLVLTFNDETVLDVAPWFSAPPGRVAVGPLAGPGLATASRVRPVRRAEDALPALRADARGRAGEAAKWVTPRGGVALEVEFPKGRSGGREPLVVTGPPGRGDLIAVEYIDDFTMRFLWDHWGGALGRSEPVKIDFNRRHTLRVALESLRPPLPGRAARPVVNGYLEIWLNGRSVWRVPGEFFAVNPVEIAVGRNPIGGTTCGPEFSGVIHRAEPERVRR